MRRGGWIWLAVGLMAIALVAGVWAGSRRAAAVSQEELLQAVDNWLKEAGVPAVDRPKRVLQVTPQPGNRYLVHMEMGLGEGWFELWQQDGQWQVRGAPPPARPGR